MYVKYLFMFATPYILSDVRGFLLFFCKKFFFIKSIFYFCVVVSCKAKTFFIKNKLN